MSLREAELRGVVDCLRAALCHGRVQDIRQPDVHRLWLQIRGRGATHQFVFVNTPNGAGAFLSERRVPNAPVPSAFLMKLRKELNGRIVQDVALHLGPARLEFVFRQIEGVAANRLLFDLTQNGGGIGLFDEVGRCIVHSGGRRVLAPPGNGVPSLEAAAEERERHGLDSHSLSTHCFEVMRRLEEEFFGKVDSSRDNSEMTWLRRAVRTALARERRKEQKIFADWSRTLEADVLRQRAEMAKPVASGLPRGTSRIEVVNWYDPHLAMTTVEFDPSVEPARQIAQWFHRAKRLEAARSGIEARLNATSRKIAQLEEVATLLEAQEPLDRESLRATLADLGVRLAPPPPPSRSEVDVKAVCRYFEAGDGSTILVGKGAKENDQLTLRIAKSDDIWLHAAGRKGAHVVLRCERGESPTSVGLVDAAALAAWYAEGGQSQTAIEVTYTRRKYVNKRRGFAPGAVSIAKAKTIFVVPDEARMNRLFGREGFARHG